MSSFSGSSRVGNLLQGVVAVEHPQLVTSRTASALTRPIHRKERVESVLRSLVLIGRSRAVTDWWPRKGRIHETTLPQGLTRIEKLRNDGRRYWDADARCTGQRTSTDGPISRRR